jgi:hypothetical protein
MARARGSLEERRPGRSGAPNTMGEKAKWRGDHKGAHLGQQTALRVVVVAHGGEAAPLGSGEAGGSTRGSSDSKKTMGSFTVMSSSSPRLQSWGATVNWWCTSAAGVWFLQDS